MVMRGVGMDLTMEPRVFDAPVVVSNLCKNLGVEVDTHRSKCFGSIYFFLFRPLY